MRGCPFHTTGHQRLAKVEIVHLLESGVKIGSLSQVLLACRDFKYWRI